MTTVTLKHPIQANGEQLTAITFQRPLVKHLKVLDQAKGDVARAALLISELGQLPPSAVDQIDGEDFAALSEVIADFFGGSLPTGGT